MQTTNATAVILPMDPAGKPRMQTHAHAACSECTLAKICLPTGLQQSELAQMDALISRSAPLHEGDHLYRVGDPFAAVYAVRSGSFKTYVIDSDGREHVLSFSLPGELMGLKAIYPRRHITNTVALDTATVCVLPYERLTTLAAELPGLQSQLMRLMSHELAEAFALAGDFTAEERIADFLVGLSQRFSQRGFSPREFNLTMSRRDIANFLRLAPETVSRVFARFEKDGLIAVERRSIRLANLPQLQLLSKCMGEMHG